MAPDSVLSLLDGVTPAGKSVWRALCPAHDDRNPSLSITETDDGTTLIKCHAGCDTAAILAELGLTMKDLFNGKEKKEKKKFPTAAAAVESLEYHRGKRSAMWTYKDAASDPAGLVVRWDRADGKEILPISRNGAGWFIGAMLTPRPLYRLPELLESTATAYIFEGEKCCDAAAALGFTATTSSGGSKTASKTDWSPLSGRDVVIFPDADEPGRQYAREVAAILAGHKARVKIVPLPVAEGGDVYDLIEAQRTDGHDDSEIRRYVEDLAATVPYIHSPAPEQQSTQEQQPIEKFTLGELIEQYPKLHPPVIDGILREGETANIISVSKVGKSWLAYALLFSIILGRDWFDRFATSKGRVLLIDNELHRQTIAYRLQTVANAMAIPLHDVKKDLEIWPLRGRMRNIYELGPELRNARGFKAIIIDAKYRMLPVGTSENDNGAETQLYNAIDSYAEENGAAFICIHHSSKGSQGDKRVTDVGAGAGAQSRAADCHLVLREHQDAGLVVFDGVVRSFAPVEPFALKWAFPLWVPADDADPSLLRGNMDRQEQKQHGKDQEGMDQIIDFMKANGGAATIRSVQTNTGIGRGRAQRLFGMLVGQRKATPREVIIRGNPTTEYQLTYSAAENALTPTLEEASHGPETERL